MRAMTPRDFAAKMGLGLSTTWQKAKDDPEFPKSIKIGGATRFIEEEGDAYLAKRMAERPGAQLLRKLDELKAGEAASTTTRKVA